MKNNTFIHIEIATYLRTMIKIKGYVEFNGNQMYIYK